MAQLSRPGPRRLGWGLATAVLAAAGAGLAVALGLPAAWLMGAMIATAAAALAGLPVGLNRAAREIAFLLLGISIGSGVKTASTARASAGAAAFTADLETWDGADAAMRHAADTFGGIDILINNVGGAIRMRPFAEFEPAQIDAEIRRSLMPTLYCCRAVLPHLLALSASSPYWAGHDTGYASNRAMMFQQLPTAGLPFQFSEWSEYERYVNDLLVTGVIDELKELRWDLRPAPQLGTLEVRVCDGVPTLQEVVRTDRTHRRIVADDRTNTLMISDIPKKIAQMRELIDVIDRPVDQVLIEGRIVIATDTFARDLGAKFGLGGKIGRASCRERV